MDKLQQRDTSQWDKHLPIFFNYLIVSIMLASFASALVGFIQVLSPGWNGAYIVIVSFLVALETLYNARISRRLSFPSRAWLGNHGTELVGMLILLKLLLYAMRGFDQLFVDVPLWQKDFLVNFFTGEYLAACVIVLLIWLCSYQFNSDLIELEADDEALERELRNEFRNDRAAVRSRLIRKTVFLAAVLILLTVVARAFLRWTRGGDAEAQIGIYNVLLYVVMGFLLLSITRYTALRASWYRERAQRSRELPLRWIAYSVTFLAVMTLIVILLPTRYTVGLLDMLKYGLGLLITILQLLIYVILFLVTLPLSLLMSLLGKGPMSPEQPAPPPKLPPVTPSEKPVADPLLEMIQSALFWVIFIIVVLYSLRQYLGRNRALVEALRNNPFLSWLAKGWNWLLTALGQLRVGIAGAVDAGLRRLRAQATVGDVMTERTGLRNLRRLSPRERVQFFYLAMVKRGNQHGVPRKPSQTPLEYSSALESAVPEINADIEKLTDSFIEARYSRHDITPARARNVQTTWNRVKAALRARLFHL